MVGLEIDVVNPTLGILAHLVETVFGPPLRRVERHQAGVVVVHAIDRAGSESENQPDHTGLGIDLGIPDKRVERKADPCRGRIELTPEGLARDAHHEQGHLLVLLQHAAPGAVLQRALAH